MVEYENIPVFDDDGNIVTEIKRPVAIGNELETALAKLLGLAKDNPDLLFRIYPNEDRTRWGVQFTKGGYWWAAMPDDGETLSETIEEAMAFFETLTDQTMMDKMQSEWQKAERFV